MNEMKNSRNRTNIHFFFLVSFRPRCDLSWTVYVWTMFLGQCAIIMREFTNVCFIYEEWS